MDIHGHVCMHAWICMHDLTLTLTLTPTLTLTLTHGRYENERLKLKHHCKGHAIRTLAPADRSTRLLALQYLPLDMTRNT